MNVTEAIGRNIAYYRHRAGMTQEHLALRMGITAQSVSKWERSISAPDISTLPDLCQTLGITVDDLFRICDEEIPPTAIEDVPWDNDGKYRLALFHGKTLLSSQTQICKPGSDLIVHVEIPEDAPFGCK